MEIRPAEPMDFVTLTQKGREVHEAMEYARFLAYDEVGFQEMLMAMIERESSCLLIAWEGDEMAGAIGGAVRKNFYDTNQLIGSCAFYVVFREHQAKGHSKALREAWEAWAVDRGADVIVYSPSNKTVIKMLERDGFEQIQVSLMKRVGEEEA